MAVVESSMNFLLKDDLYKREKPYQLRYTPEDGIPVTNFRIKKQDPLQISSMRGRESQFSFETNGFAVLKVDENNLISYDDFSKPEAVRRYMSGVCEHVKELLGADKVQAYQYIIRKRDPCFPRTENKTYEFNQPATVAHIDATAEEATSTFRQVNGEPSPNLRYQVVNIWKPLRGPLRDWPLALCDAASVRESDLAAADVVFEHKVTENLQVHYSAEQKWYYLENQEANELLVFRQTDSHPGVHVGVPHSSFPNRLAGAHELPRESIEVRTLVSYRNE